MKKQNKPSTNLKTEIAIIGGGLVGLSLGLGLAQKGFSCMVIDKALDIHTQADDYDGRASAISYSSGLLFKALGLWDGLAPYAEPIQSIRVADGDIEGMDLYKQSSETQGISPLILDFNAPELAPSNENLQKEIQSFGWIIENRQMLKVIKSLAINQENLIRIEGVGVAKLSLPKDHLGQDYPSIELEDGRKIEAGLVIGADGKLSQMRKAAGLSYQEFDYHQNAIVCTLEHERTHQGTAVELFLPAGPFAMLPMTGQRTSIVWSEKRELAKQVIKLNDDEFMHELKRRFGDWLGEIKLVGPRFSYPLTMIMTPKIIAPRLCLVGDAAHAIHPIAGQGFNLGLRDIAALCEVLEKARNRGEDIGSNEVLNRYQSWRRVDTIRLSLVCDGLLRLFSNKDPILSNTRRFGLNLLNQMPIAKKFFTSHAMGKTTNPLPIMLQE